MDLARIAQDLLRAIGDPRPFPNSEYPYPLHQSLWCQWDLEALRARAQNVGSADLEGQLATLLALAEAVEASQSDRDELFIGDRELRARLVRLNTTAGWALLWGDDSEKTARLAGLLQQEGFQVYTVGPETLTGTLRQAKSLGSRPTSPIYFYQAVVRYPHIYGRVPLGDDHGISDFNQDYGPAVMFLAREDLSSLEEALFLGGLSLGIPAVVPNSFPLPYGTALRADTPDAMVETALDLPNLRLRRRLRFRVDMPFGFDYSFAAEEIEGGIAIGGTPSSSFVVTNVDKGDGVEVVGELAPDVGIEIAVGDRRVDLTMTDYLEEFAGQLPAYIEGVAAEVRAGCPTIRWRADLPLQAAHLGQAYYSGLKAHFDLDRLKVRLVFQAERLDRMRLEAEGFRERRTSVLAVASEETEPFFYSCIRCHSFALDHACIVTPERPPQCGSRSWMHIKTRAILSEVDSGGLTTWQRGSALHGVVEKRACLDQAKGEFQEVNEAIGQLTEGRTRRVFLHSLFEHPHTACSCFQGVAFYMAAVDGIGLIDRSYKGCTPDGRGWDDVANAVAGKQSSGYAAFSEDYLRSRKFLAGDGGWNRVVWMPHRLKARFAPDRPWIATEALAGNLPELAEFLKGQRS